MYQTNNEIIDRERRIALQAYLQFHRCFSRKNKDELTSGRTVAQFRLFFSLYGLKISPTFPM